MKLLVLYSILLTITLVNGETSQEFISANNRFAADIYKGIARSTQDNNNFVVSPFSTEVILALAQSGAKDATGDEIRAILHTQSLGRTENTFKTVLSAIKDSEGYSVHTANRIYTKNQIPLRKSFQHKAQEIYQAGVETLDFKNPLNSARVINGFVEEQTRGKIRDLIDPARLSDDLEMILVNCLYFQGNWSNTFNSFISQVDFYRYDGIKSNVSMMHKTGVHPYFESKTLNAKFLRLYFQSEDASMVIVLPNDKYGLERLENNIEEVLNEKNLVDDLVKIQLPKFQIENKIDFSGILQRLGLRTAFTSYADFSGIAGRRGDLSISDVLQKAFIDVNQNGVEAAAATYAGYVLLSGSSFLGEPKPFVADHPFMFYIQVKDVVLFVGRVADP